LSDRLKYFGEARGRASRALVRVSREGEGEGEGVGRRVLFSLLGLGKRGKVSIYTSGG